MKPVKAGHAFSFTDALDVPRLNVLAATGTWIGDNLASKVNTVKIFCEPSAKTCEVTQADVTKLLYSPMLNLDKTTYDITKINFNL